MKTAPGAAERQWVLFGLITDAGQFNGGHRMIGGVVLKGTPTPTTNDVLTRGMYDD